MTHSASDNCAGSGSYAGTNESALSLVVSGELQPNTNNNAMLTNITPTCAVFIVLFPPVIKTMVRRFEQQNWDYSSRMVKLRAH
jgi:hypothetical protein